MQLSKIFKLTASFALFLAIVPPLRAQVLEEIVVTATKREQDIQDVGIAITALGGQQLSELGISNSEDLTSVVPGLVIGTFGSQATTTPTIRGVSQNDFADHNEPPVAIYTDGAYNSFIGGAGFNMFDVERVEVLRGPQGTLFGRNATGGLVHVISRKPTPVTEGYAELTLGEHNLVEFEGAFGGPISDNLLGRISVARRKNDGYIQNTLGPALQGTDNLSARLQLQFRPSDTFDALLNLRTSRDDVTGSVGYVTPRAIFSFTDPAHLVFNPSTPAAFADFCTALFDANTPAPITVTATSTCSGAERPGVNNPYLTAIDNPGFMNRNTHGITLTANWKFSSAMTLTSITDYLTLKRDYSEDTDGTAFRLFNFFSFMDSNQLSQELRLAWDTDRSHWIAGAYYLKINHDIRTGIDGVPDANTLNFANPDVLFPFITDNRTKQKTASYAAFAQADFAMSKKLSLTTGLRWSHDKKDMDFAPTCGGDIFGFTCAILAAPGTIQGSGYVGSQSHGDFAAKLQLDYRPHDNALWYLGITRGNKGGGFNAAAIAGIPSSAASYKPEVLTDYEGGFKLTLLGRALRLNGSAFYYDYRNYQAFTLTGLAPTIFNTDAKVKGGELELDSSPIEGLDLSLGTAYLDSKAQNVPSNLLPGAVNLGTQTTPQSPKWTFNGLVRYQWPAFGGHLALQGDFNFVGKRAFNTVNHPALFDNSYTLANARLTYTAASKKWDVALWAKNLTNETYTSFAFDFSGSDGTAPGAVNPPRWIGASTAIHW